MSSLPRESSEHPRAGSTAGSRDRAAKQAGKADFRAGLERQMGQGGPREPGSTKPSPLTEIPQKDFHPDGVDRQICLGSSVFWGSDLKSTVGSSSGGSGEHWEAGAGIHIYPIDPCPGGTHCCNKGSLMGKE